MRATVRLCPRIRGLQKQRLYRLDVALLEHVSPIEWHNVILYGQHVLDRAQVR
jgi:hypothetical protein